jgi:hypothetical protein
VSAGVDQWDGRILINEAARLVDEKEFRAALEKEMSHRSGQALAGLSLTSLLRMLSEDMPVTFRNLSKTKSVGRPAFSSPVRLMDAAGGDAMGFLISWVLVSFGFFTWRLWSYVRWSKRGQQTIAAAALVGLLGQGVLGLPLAGTPFKFSSVAEAKILPSLFDLSDQASQGRRLRFQASQDYAKGDGEVLLRLFIDYTHRLDDLPLAPRPVTKETERLQKTLWKALQDLIVDPSLKKELSRPYSPDGFHQFLLFKVPEFLAGRGVFTTFSKFTIDEHHFIKAGFYKIGSVETFPSDALPLEELEGGRRPQVVYLNGLVRLSNHKPQEDFIGPVVGFVAYKTIFIKSSELDREILVARENGRIALSNLNLSDSTMKATQFRPQFQDILRAVEGGEDPLKFGFFLVQVKFALSIKNQSDKEVRNRILDSVLKHEASHLKDFKRTQLRKDQDKKGGVMTPPEIQEWMTETGKRNELRAILMELSYSPPLNALDSLTTYHLSDYLPYQFAAEWILDHGIDLILKRPEFFGMEISKNTKVPPRQQVEMQLIRLTEGNALPSLARDLIRLFEETFYPAPSQNGKEGPSGKEPTRKQKGPEGKKRPSKGRLSRTLSPKTRPVTKPLFHLALVSAEDMPIVEQALSAFQAAKEFDPDRALRLLFAPKDAETQGLLAKTVGRMARGRDDVEILNPVCEGRRLDVDSLNKQFRDKRPPTPFNLTLTLSPGIEVGLTSAQADLLSLDQDLRQALKAALKFRLELIDWRNRLELTTMILRNA